VEEGPTLPGFSASDALRRQSEGSANSRPSLIVLVRRVRVRPTLIFQGKVEGDAIVAENRPAPALPTANPKSNATPPRKPSRPPTIHRRQSRTDLYQTALEFKS